MAAGATTNIAGGKGPAYVICALPYRNDVVGREVEWGLDTALAIVEEAVDAFDPPRIEARPVRATWPEELQECAKVCVLSTLQEAVPMHSGGRNCLVRVLIVAHGIPIGLT